MIGFNFFFTPVLIGLIRDRRVLDITAISLAILVALQSWPAMASEPKADRPRPPQSQSVSEWVTLAGRIDHRSAEDLRREDTLVIDLRMDEEDGLKDEQDRLANAGVQYVHLPTGRSVPSVAQVRRLEKVLNDNPNRPILLHCSSGNRAGMLWATHLIEQGMDPESALKRVQPIANRAPIQQAILGYRAGEKE